MKRLNDILFSMTTTVILLLVFGISIAYATFAEKNHGTAYAHEIVYNAKWFEFLLVLVIVNLTGSLIRYKMTDKKKFGVLLFHLSFVVILIGAGITRYLGSEGIMHLREGETLDEITSGNSSVLITAELNGLRAEKRTKFRFSANKSNNFSKSVKIDGRTITVKERFVIPHIVETIEEKPQGNPALELFVMDRNNLSEKMILEMGESAESNGQKFTFDGNAPEADFIFTTDGGNLLMKAKVPVSRMHMMEKEETELSAGTLISVQPRTVYKTGEIIFVLRKYFQHAGKSLVQSNMESNSMHRVSDAKAAVLFNVSSGNNAAQLYVMMPENGTIQTGTCIIDGINVTVSHGNLPQKLPFSITLREFQLDRYSGSNSPSSYASEITLNDPEMDVVKPYRIFMNNILHYRGYRFYQSSYDSDEKGSVLLVNHDYWGTLVTYAGYLLMMIGMILTLFSKNSRFRTVIRLSKNSEDKGAAARLMVLALMVVCSSNLMAADKTSDKKQHLGALSSLLIQDRVQGRIEPISTYASDVIRKITKKSSYKGQSALEVFISMTVNPAEWLNEPVIKVAHEGLARELGAIGEYVSFTQLIHQEENGMYVLSEKINAVYQKAPSMRGQYEKELMNVDERLNILNSLFHGTLLNIFPDKTGTGWTAVPRSVAGSNVELNDTGSILHQDSYPGELLNAYLSSFEKGCQTGDWNNADMALINLKNYQVLNGGNQIPSTTKIKMEVLYNNLSIFLTLGILYGLLGVVLISLHLLNILKYCSKTEKRLNRSIYPLLLMFIMYTGGLALRWYISGHAPWSNGYESMIFVGWATALAGLVFANRSPVILAITSLLAAIALSVAGMSWMNPEITNLVPVLKSYWLVFHVVIIMSSYGFFATAALMALFNLFLMITRTGKNAIRLNENIRKFSYIIELLLTVGLFMLAIGCVLGGIWANESWGRYWGWDAKETWALVSILVYSIILHLRKIPAMNNMLLFNIFSFIGFASILMTYLGVNYYLSGMHSYGQ